MRDVFDYLCFRPLQLAVPEPRCVVGAVHVGVDAVVQPCPDVVVAVDDAAVGARVVPVLAAGVGAVAGVRRQFVAVNVGVVGAVVLDGQQHVAGVACVGGQRDGDIAGVAAGAVLVVRVGTSVPHVQIGIPRAVDSAESRVAVRVGGDRRVQRARGAAAVVEHDLVVLRAGRVVLDVRVRQTLLAVVVCRVEVDSRVVADVRRGLCVGRTAVRLGGDELGLGALGLLRRSGLGERRPSVVSCRRRCVRLRRSAGYAAAQNAQSRQSGCRQSDTHLAGVQSYSHETS